MPIFYFHLGFNGRVLTDDEGTELTDRTAARAEAQAIIRELATTASRPASECYLRVSDAEGPFLHLPVDGPALEVVPTPRPSDSSRQAPAQSVDPRRRLTALAAQIAGRRDRTEKLMQQNRRLRQALASELQATERIRNQTLHLLACARALDCTAGVFAGTRS